MSECALLSIGDMSDLSAGPEQEGVADFDLVAVAGGEAELPVAGIAPLEEGAEVDGILELNTTASPVVCEGLGRAACMGCPLLQQCLERQQMTEGVADDGKSYLEELLDEEGPVMVMARPPAPEVTAPSPTLIARERVPAVPPVEPRPPMVKPRPAGDEVADSREVTVESSGCASDDLPPIADSMPGVITPVDALSPPLALQQAPQANDTSASLQALTREVDMVQRWTQSQREESGGRLSDLPVAVTEPHDGAGGVVPESTTWTDGDEVMVASGPAEDWLLSVDQLQQTTVSQKPLTYENRLPNDVEKTTAMVEVGDDDQNAITVPRVAEVSRVVAGAYQFRNDASPKGRAAGNEVGADNYEVVNTTDEVFSCEIARTPDCAIDTETVIPVDAPASEANAAPLEIQPALDELCEVAEYEGGQAAMRYVAADKYTLPQPAMPAVVLLQEWHMAAQQIAGVAEVGDVAVPDSTVDMEFGLPTGVPCDESAEAVTLQNDVNNTTMMPHYSNNNNTAPEDNPEYAAGGVRGMTAGSAVSSIVLGVVAVWVTVARGLVRQPSTV